MNYNELLNKIIDSSKLTNKEILEKLKEKNINITPNYLSVIKNQKDKMASEELSTAISEICKYPYNKALAVQGYLDKAPKEIIEYTELTAKSMISTSLAILEQIDNEEMKSKKSQIENILKNLSTSELICELLENKEIFFSTDNTPLEITEKLKMPTKYAVIPINTIDDIKYLTTDEILGLNK